MMTRVSYSELRNNLASLMDELCESGTPLLVTRRNAGNVVIVSEHDYGGLMHTVHLLGSPANAARLLRSIRQAGQGKLQLRDVIEPAKPR